MSDSTRLVMDAVRMVAESVEQLRESVNGLVAGNAAKLAELQTCAAKLEAQLAALAETVADCKAGREDWLKARLSEQPHHDPDWRTAGLTMLRTMPAWMWPVLAVVIVGAVVLTLLVK